MKISNSGTLRPRIDPTTGTLGKYPAAIELNYFCCVRPSVVGPRVGVKPGPR